MKNKIVLITGGTAGVGLELSKLYAKEDNTTVIICGRTIREIPSSYNLDFFRCDLTDINDLKKISEYIKNKYNKLDLLVNNAGLGERFSIHQVEHLYEKSLNEWKINYAAPLMLVKYLLPLIKESTGKIINITSGLVYAPLSLKPNYCAYKSALHSFTISLRQQLDFTGIKVIEVLYPQMNTEFQNGVYSKNALDITTAAEIAYKGIEKNKEEIHVKTAVLLKILSSLSSRLARKIINKRVEILLTEYNLNMHSFTEERLQERLKMKQ